MRSVFFLICVYFLGVRSAVIYSNQVEIQGHEGKCYDKSAKIFYNKGDLMKVEEDECIQIKCLGFLYEIGKLSIEILTCPTVEAGPGFSIIQDRSKPYPECCPQIVSMPSIDPKFCRPQRKEM